MKVSALLSILPDVSSSMAYNLRTLKENPWGEIAGSLGDLGTLLPLMTALTAQNCISLGSTLFFTGIFNIFTGAVFGLPLPVQPMKAIAAVALTRGLTLSQTMGAGLTASLAVLLLSISGLLGSTAQLVPIPIVKGIQLGAGLSLFLTAGSTLTALPRSWDDNIYWAVGSFFVLYASCRLPRFPFALLLFLLGIIFAFTHTFLFPPSFNPSLPTFSFPLPNDLKVGFLTAGLGQLPLTLLNSVIAVSHLSVDLLPSRPAPTFTSLGLSIAIMNLTSNLFGSMPVCHGSGGLAAQYRFGARSGASTMILGLFKAILGLSFGDSLTELLDKFPKAFLGIMVLAAGMELCSIGENLNTTARDVANQLTLSKSQSKDRWTVMMTTAGTLIAFRDGLVGFLAGLVVWGLLRVQYWIAKTWERGERGERQVLLRR